MPSLFNHASRPLVDSKKSQMSRAPTINTQVSVLPDTHPCVRNLRTLLWIPTSLNFLVFLRVAFVLPL